MPWYVLYTKPRNEKKLAGLLTNKGITVFCPVADTIKQWSDRKKKVSIPVFTSYLFIWLNDYKSDCEAVLNTPGAVRFLWWLGKPGTVRDVEIVAIKNFLSAYKDVTLQEVPAIGKEAIINEGPLKANNGEIIEIRGRKAVLHLKSLNINLIAEVPISSISITN